MAYRVDLTAGANRDLRRVYRAIDAAESEQARACFSGMERVQRGHDPDDWKPMTSVGSGVREIRIRDEASAFRVIYIATPADAVYVLHAFQKKTQQTPGRDPDFAAEPRSSTGTLTEATSAPPVGSVPQNG